MLCLTDEVTDTYRRILLAARPRGLADDSTLLIDDTAEVPEPADGQALVARTLGAFGDLDILIVNHGIWPEASPAAAITPAMTRKTERVP